MGAMLKRAPNDGGKTILCRMHVSVTAFTLFYFI